ncbi:kelch repeat and BTB domain-containing protein 7-like [Dreissena polymorpha]|uniref:BTB domain-containing protein n=1 Tax=Dreissena polymorpha TaxID=45954 RepID=A0A9D4R4K5_DREPO|nr:kelch repeat and BTB domain-containing protein 7-like [Dreissena polymorpha]XP_052276341.1 kelch repeat and BTB domain-containing protein 7-like [Dreissena polymorpha]KAH3853727.1 hypothetical protein DPMN_096259 [Dreissena polymorpha]
MVVYQAPAEHFSTTLHSINDLRKDESFCDVVLRVGHAEIKAHKCVLAAGSPYFRSLFLGQFTESSKSEIDLSQVTTDNISMELIINFIYSGEVDIDSENLGDIIKLSSFFLLEALRGFCADFMRENLCLKTCLTYFMYSADHGLNELEINAGLMIRARFHDCLIYEDETLNLTIDELMFIHGKHIMKHCSKSSLLQYLMKWVTKGKTEDHVKACLDILDALDKRSSEYKCSEIYSGLTEICLESLFSVVCVALKESGVQDKESLLSKFSHMLADFKPNRKLHTGDSKSNTAENTPGTSTGYSKQSPEKSKFLFSGCKAETELAVVTLTPKLCVIEDYRKQREESIFHHEVEPFRQPVFDICAYVPRTRTWYHLCELQEANTPEYLVDGAGYESRFLVMGDYAAFIDNRGDNIDLYNFQTKQWSAPSVEYYDLNFDMDFDDNFQANDVCFVLGKDDTKYMIVRMRLFSDHSFDQATEMYFRGYVLRDDGQSWDCIFVTPTKIRTNLSDNGGMPEMTARISKKSNELIVTHSTLDGGWNMVFVANLNDPFPSPITLKSEFIENQDEFRGVAILEDDDRFLIVSNGTKNCNSKVKILYEYKFNSKELIECKDTSKELVVSSMLGPYFEDDEEIEYPCLCELSASDGSSIWYMEGNMETVSSFVEITFGKNGTPSRTDHPPPPFACFTRAFAGQISKKHLTNAKQVSRFLFREKKVSSPEKSVSHFSRTQYSHYSS